MNKKELKSALLKQLAAVMTKHDFEKRVYGQSLKKPIENGTAKIHLAFINHVNDFDVTVDVGIRFNELENLRHEHNSSLTPKEKANTSSIGIELGNLSIGKQRRWTINSEEDIDSVIQNIYEEIQMYILPFIDNYSNTENVYNQCINDDGEATLISPINYIRAINAVGLAIILKKEEQLNVLIETKRKYLEDKNDFGLPLYLSFIENHIKESYKH